MNYPWWLKSEIQKQNMGLWLDPQNSSENAAD